MSSAPAANDWRVDQVRSWRRYSDGSTKVVCVLESKAELPLLPRDHERIRVVRQAEPCPLGERQLQCLELLSEGLLYKQIAERLDVAVSTVRSHLRRIYVVLAVPDRAQAVLLAKEKGWL